MISKARFIFKKCINTSIYLNDYIHFYNKILEVGIGQMSRVFANDLGDQGSTPGRVIPKTQKISTWCRIA